MESCCSQCFLIRFSFGSPRFQCIPQHVPNSTSLLSHTLCPELSPWDPYIETYMFSQLEWIFLYWGVWKVSQLCGWSANQEAHWQKFWIWKVQGTPMQLIPHVINSITITALVGIIRGKRLLRVVVEPHGTWSEGPYGTGFSSWNLIVYSCTPAKNLVAIRSRVFNEEVLPHSFLPCLPLTHSIFSQKNWVMPTHLWDP